MEPPPAFRIGGTHRSGEQPEAANVDIESLVPLFFRNLLGGSNVQDSRIIQQNIESAEMRHGVLDDAGNFVFLGHIRRERERGGADLTSNFFEERFAPSNERNSCAFSS
jgi:hypothetical protein